MHRPRWKCYARDAPPLQLTISLRSCTVEYGRPAAGVEHAIIGRGTVVEQYRVMPALGIALAALVGLSLGVMGGGGSILTVPIFVYVLGYDPKLAIAMSLPVVGITSAVGAMSHWRNGNVNLPRAATFGVLAMCGAFIGSRIAQYLSGAAQLVALGVVMLVASVLMFRSARASRVSGPSHVDGQVDAHVVTLGGHGGWVVPTALAVGALTGVVGVGGGFLVVPALVLLRGAPMREAVGTSLVVIALNCAAAMAGTASLQSLPWIPVLQFAGVAALGTLLGARLANRVPTAALKQMFALLLIVMSAVMLYRNRAVFSAAEQVGSSLLAPTMQRAVSCI
jgi:uncharacterized protein